MLVYNVTTKVATAIQDAWLLWMQQVHLPQVLATGCFEKAVVLRLKDTDDSEGPTFAVQFHTASEDDYRRYLEIHEPGYKVLRYEKWRDQFISFSTLMEVVH